MVVEVAQAFPQFGGLEAPEEPQEPEVPHYATNGAGNGAGRGQEVAMAEPETRVETVAVEYEMAARPEDMVAPIESAPADDETEAETQRSSISQRFAARRERRRTGKPSSGGSLRDRLRGLVAEQPKA
jgi:hypothetical protein